MSHRPAKKKIGILAMAGLAGVVVGFALTPVSPMIKRICTSSFVLASGGFCLRMLAFSYWFIDVKGLRKWTTFFNIVGMNSLFIYIFTQTGATEWLAHLVKPFANAFFGWTGTLGAEIVVSLAAWALLWSMCYWLYRRKILIKI
jgi:predicted acyltransferase